MPMPMKTEATDDDADGAVREEAQRDERLLTHGPLEEEEGDETGEADGVAGDRGRRAPAPRAALLGHDEQRHEGDREAEGAPVVDAVVEARVLEVQRARHDDERGDGDRHVDEEDPAPAGDAEDASPGRRRSRR